MVRILIISFVLTGCATKTLNVCPVFPKPSQEVLDTLKGINDKNVNSWLEELYKLNLKLGVTNGTI